MNYDDLIRLLAQALMKQRQPSTTTTPSPALASGIPSVARDHTAYARPVDTRATAGQARQAQIQQQFGTMALDYAQSHPADPYRPTITPAGLDSMKARADSMSRDAASRQADLVRALQLLNGR